jgi:hypothetical protein
MAGGFGRCYANGTGLSGSTFLTGWSDLIVKEIEVFAVNAEGEEAPALSQSFESEEDEEDYFDEIL